MEEAIQGQGTYGPSVPGFYCTPGLALDDFHLLVGSTRASRLDHSAGIVSRGFDALAAQAIFDGKAAIGLG